MAIHFSNGIGQLFEKSIDKPIAQIKYHLIETDPTKYTRKKWWGDFQSNNGLKDFQLSGTLRINFDDGRNGECVVWLENENGSESGSKNKVKKTTANLYHFNGRGKLIRGNSGI